MNLGFLPDNLRRALNNVNCNFLNEIRLRNGQAVILQYKGEYTYINDYTLTGERSGAIKVDRVDDVLNRAMENSVYAYSEQLKRGFITVGGGIRIGVAGTYVTQGGEIISVKNVTSLNVRIPHDVYGASAEIFRAIGGENAESTLIFSKAGFGKTTVLRDLARICSSKTRKNILIYDERNEVAAGTDFNLGENCDVVTGGDKKSAFESAVRAMRPQIIISDELYGDDFSAVKFAADCGITVIASSHVSDRNILKNMPFKTYVELTGIAQDAIVYDKNFNIVCNCSTVGGVGRGNFG